MAAAGAILAGVGIGLGVIGTKKQERAAKAAGEAEGQAYDYKAAVAGYNADLARMQAGLETQVGDRNARISQIQGSERLEGAKAKYAAGNIDTSSGSANTVLNDIDSFNKFDVLTIRNNAARQAWNYMNQAAGWEQNKRLDELSAASVRKGGRAAAEASIISGASNIANQASRFFQVYGGGSSTSGSLDV